MAPPQAVILAAIALASTARAGTPVTPSREACAEACTRERLAAQLADEAATIERALQMVLDKLADGSTARARRLAAAYRILQADPVREHGEPSARARRRAGAHFLVARDLDERHLLADEAARLRAAAARLASEAHRVPTVALPPALERPARGPIVRRFGTLVHDRSKATLARRGIDLDVEAHAWAVAPADATVRYAGPIRGLDGGVILDHGDYYTVIGKLGEILLPIGAVVRGGDRIGRAARHRVYLEVRVKLGAGGRPIDPEPLLVDRDRKKR